jgi:hypothetical protein
VDVDAQEMVWRVGRYPSDKSPTLTGSFTVSAGSVSGGDAAAAPASTTASDSSKKTSLAPTKKAAAGAAL